MFISGTKEWIGSNGYKFLYVRSILEQKLLSLGYEYFYGGGVSKRTVYEPHYDILGEKFKQIFIDFFSNQNKYIFSPEYTFRVYEYLERKDCLKSKENKVFYSQEMMRNETTQDIEEGKTFSFWQIGFENFGGNEKNLSNESVNTLIDCLQSISLPNLFFRITDKRIFEELCKKHSIQNFTETMSILESCNEDPEKFYLKYTKNGGNKFFADELRYVLELSKNGSLKKNDLLNLVDTALMAEIIEGLKEVEENIYKNHEQTEFILVPAMPKTWDAYTTIVFDARLKDYDKAIAGGGNLFINPQNQNTIHSGAGIGVTRIVEYLIDKETF